MRLRNREVAALANRVPGVAVVLVSMCLLAASACKAPNGTAPTAAAPESSPSPNVPQQDAQAAPPTPAPATAPASAPSQSSASRRANSHPESSSAPGNSSPSQSAKKPTYDFEDDLWSAPGQPNRLVISEVTIVGDETIERYPNIEAPDTVAMGQEIAVQVSLSSEQIAPETKILSGTQHDGKLQLKMAAGEERWTLTVNLTAPGMEFTRNGNTANITITKDSDSTIAVFYLRPTASAADAPRRDTRILATLLHDGAFIARLSRPLTIVASTSQPAAPPSSVSAASFSPARDAEAQTIEPTATSTATGNTPKTKGEMPFDPDLQAPDLTIVENRVGNTLRVVFFSQHSAPVEADIPDPDALHAWIESHFAQMAARGRGLTPVSDGEQGTSQHAADYINGFGSELYDKFAPQAFKDLFWKLVDNSTNRNPGNAHALEFFQSIQVLSDDPAIPWELMRPARADGSQRMDFLGLHFMVARWPLSAHTGARPRQALTVSQSAVIAPVYRGALQLSSAGEELTALKKMKGFAEVPGDYAAVRNLAMHPPQGIVHFAGHGAVTDRGGVPQFAILLQDSEMDPATWSGLGAADSAVHPLFFFNACDVGESRRFLNDVDGWAPVLLSSGASGYIGALWPVNDAIAEAVAASFYLHVSERLTGQGANVAEALAKARADVFSKTSDPTALAYVFYGDPNFVLTDVPNPAAK